MRITYGYTTEALSKREGQGSEWLAPTLLRKTHLLAPCITQSKTLNGEGNEKNRRSANYADLALLLTSHNYGIS